jgi:hypothetical protein
MRAGIIILGLAWLLVACSEAPVTHVEVIVQDKHNALALDSAKVLLYQQYPDQPEKLVDSQFTDSEGKVQWEFHAETGFAYYVLTEKRHYQATINELGSAYENRQAIDPGMMNNTLYLYLELIPPPDPERFEKMYADVSVNEVIAALKDSSWEWAFLPRLTWEDVPQLMALAADTGWIAPYPIHPLSTYRPEKARIGLVALWLVEAVRRMEAQGGELAGNLMPPSRTPILGTRRGNPSGYNSPQQMRTAQQAYLDWWEKAKEAENRQKAARSNPLLGKGLSWM